jgi:hypothetical protein
VSTGVKWPASEADHSPSSVQVKNGGAVTPLTHKSLWPSAKLTKSMDDFIPLLLNEQ